MNVIESSDGNDEGVFVKSGLPVVTDFRGTHTHTHTDTYRHTKFPLKIIEAQAPSSNVESISLISSIIDITLIHLPFFDQFKSDSMANFTAPSLNNLYQKNHEVIFCKCLTLISITFTENGTRANIIKAQKGA